MEILSHITCYYPQIRLDLTLNVITRCFKHVLLIFLAFCLSCFVDNLILPPKLFVTITSLAIRRGVSVLDIVFICLHAYVLIIIEKEASCKKNETCSRDYYLS